MVGCRSANAQPAGMRPRALVGVLKPTSTSRPGKRCTPLISCHLNLQKTGTSQLISVKHTLITNKLRKCDYNIGMNAREWG